MNGKKTIPYKKEFLLEIVDRFQTLGKISAKRGKTNIRTTNWKHMFDTKIIQNSLK